MQHIGTATIPLLGWFTLIQDIKDIEQDMADAAYARALEIYKMLRRAGRYQRSYSYDDAFLSVLTERDKVLNYGGRIFKSIFYRGSERYTTPTKPAKRDFEIRLRTYDHLFIGPCRLYFDKNTRIVVWVMEQSKSDAHREWSDKVLAAIRRTSWVRGTGGVKFPYHPQHGVCRAESFGVGE